MPETEQDTGAPPRPLIVAATVIAVALAVGVAVFAVVMGSAEDERPGAGPLPLVPVPAPQADSAQCTTLVRALPLELTSNGVPQSRRTLAHPAPAATVAWGDADPIVLRCGLDRPPELTQTSELRIVSGVQWLPVEGQGASTWYVVDREVYLALTVPDSTGTGPLQEISNTIAANLPAVPLRF